MKNNSMHKGRCSLFFILYLIFPLFFFKALATSPVFTDKITVVLLQQTIIHGTITDDNGEPLPGVTVTLKDLQRGVISGSDGYFSITASPEDTLIFSILGFVKQMVPVNQQQEINIQLAVDVTELEGVTVNAGYYTVKEKELTGSIEKITSIDIEKQPISNPLAALQGRMAGVEIEQTSGLAGANFNIRIRGQNSIRSGGNEPMYIVDGVPFSSSSIGEQQTSSSVLQGGALSPLNNINPTDIESIEILKDADATAIYGSRGANGVVLITTKKGKGGRAKIELNLLSGLGMVTNTLNLLSSSEYMTLRREAYANDGIDPLPATAYDVNGTWDQNRQTDWQKELYGKTAYLTNLQSSISGGSEKTQFLVSGNYHKQKDVFLGNYYNDKISGMTNLNHVSQNNKFSLQLTSSFSSSDNDLPATGLVLSAVNLAPNAPELYDDNGELNWENSTWSNPLRNLEGIYRSHGTNWVTNIKIGYDILESLNLSTNLGYTESHLREIKTIPSTIYAPPFSEQTSYSTAIHNMGMRNSWLFEPQLSWKPTFGGVRMALLTGLTFQSQGDRRLSQVANGFTNNNLIENLAAASTIRTITDQFTEYRYQALFGRINLNLKGRYILNITGRRDGSSRFGTSNRFSNFGAVGAAWIFSDEPFIKDKGSFLSFGKLRGSYGTSGNDLIGDYQYLDTYSFGGTQYQGIVGLYPTRLYNPNFSWESNKKLEFATEFGMIEDRILLAVSHYRNRSSNQLVGIPLPATTGFSSINANLDATVENTGWEIELSTINIRKKGIQWSTSLNVTIPKNRLVSFPDLEGSTYANQLVIGQPLEIIKVYELEGVNPETGLYELKDFNGDDIISAIDDKQVIKNLGPKLFGGFENNISFGRFHLDVLFRFTKQLGFNYWTSTSVVGGLYNQPRAVLDRWQNPGDIARVQRFTTGQSAEAIQAFSNFTQSDATISDASFIRLQNVSLSYELSSMDKLGFGCHLFIRGQNLWTLTRYKGLDPETRSDSTVPTLRFITIGTRLTF